MIDRVGNKVTKLVSSRNFRWNWRVFAKILENFSIISREFLSLKMKNFFANTKVLFLKLFNLRKRKSFN